MSEVVKVEQDQTALIQVIERAAMNPDIDIEKMERLLAMKERIDAKAAEASFNAAMALVQSEIGRVSADASNSQTRSRYASYSQLDRAVRPIYTKYGFALSFGTEDAPIPECVRVVCDISHKHGHSARKHIDIPADGKGAKGGDVMTKTHATGSATQYGMRYLLKMIFNIAIGEDDDGNAAGTETITLDQATEINDLLKETKSSLAAFLKTFDNAPSVSQLPARHYDRAVRMLKKKRDSANA